MSDEENISCYLEYNKNMSGRVSQSQLEKLLDVLSETGVLVKGKVDYTKSKTNHQTFWKQMAVQLNAVPGGSYKNSWKWCKAWTDWKNNTKKKANILLRRKQYKGMSPQNNAPLTTLERRLLKIMQYPLNTDDAFNLKMINENRQKMNNTPLADDGVDQYENIQIKESGSVCDGEVNSCNEQENPLCDDLSNDGIILGIIKETSDINNERVTDRDTVQSEIPQEYRTTSFMDLEKERAFNKSEELRLKALELKLKGDELKLKEREMNKINYLTNIEEEKLKCFREISASLKELVERSRNGNGNIHL